MPTLVASALDGGDCINDANTLRVGRTAGVLGFTVKAPSTVGTFLRGFRWGPVRQLDRVSRELPARAWAAVAEAGDEPADGPLTIDLDSTVCETYGLKKEGARHHGYTGQRGYHPLLAVAAGTGEVLMARLRAGPATLLLPGRTPHPQGAPLHAASPAGPATAQPVWAGSCLQVSAPTPSSHASSALSRPHRWIWAMTSLVL